MNNDQRVIAENCIADAIHSAQEFRDPFDELIDKTAANPGAPFEPHILATLAALQMEDRSTFEALRARLKRVGCRVSALDEALAAEVGNPSGRDLTQADILIELAQKAELFHAPDGTGYADVYINGHRETWPIRTKGFRSWLVRQYFEATNGVPRSEALQAALNVLEAIAHFDRPERVIHIRVGGMNERLYLDLCDEHWRAVEIDADGWRVIDTPPVRFRRAAGMQALPTPSKGGSVERLRAYLNVQSDADFVLAVAWALAVLRNRGPYPVIVLSGEQGSAKSTFSLILRSLLDPNTAPLRALPRESRDLFIAAHNGHVLAFDNVSGLPPWISDTLCRLATGGGFAVRELYTDQDEVLFDAARPVILNGIEEIVSRPDLADRALFLTLEPIREENRRSEKDLWAAFEAERPQLLGALLDAIAEGLKQLPNIHLEKLPRMADFALWASACETALWPPKTFWNSYCANQRYAAESVIEADPISLLLQKFMDDRTKWTGTCAELLQELRTQLDNENSIPKGWPNTPRKLSGILRRAASPLRTIGIKIMFSREDNRKRSRIVTIISIAHSDFLDGEPSKQSKPRRSDNEPPF